MFSSRLRSITVHDPKLVRRQLGRYDRDDLHRQRPFTGGRDYSLQGGWPRIGDTGLREGQLTRGIRRDRLDDDLETRSNRTLDSLLLLLLRDPYRGSDRYRKSILDRRLRTTYTNSTFTSLYHKYGY